MTTSTTVQAPIMGGSSHEQPLSKMALIALGIVFGDIGTSPLYAFQVTLAATGHKVPTELDALGIASMIIWALFATILIKYITLVLRADNDGQGGILALISLVKPASWSAGAGMGALGVLGVIGAAFLYGDGVITPAISVLSAMEGMKVLAPSFETMIIPATLVVLVGLFSIQRIGTHSIGRCFGPVMLTWFFIIGTIGIYRISQHPGVVVAFQPAYAFMMIKANFAVAAGIFGAVFLVLTGGEALYADMGHVGKSAIRWAFILVVLPALVLNYLGQASLVIVDPSTADNPFFKAVPSFFLVPMILLAAVATVIASQALISGVFSLTRQAIQMSIFPRMKVIQTHHDEEGQIYVPVVNWLLMVGTVFVVLSFRSSEHLAAAYGIAVSGTEVITTILLFHVIRDKWQQPGLARLVLCFFGVLDVSFLISNSTKFFEGGWLPIAVGATLTFMMTSWRAGTWAVRRSLNESAQPLDEFIAHIDDANRGCKPKVQRVKGCAVWMTKVTDGVTRMLSHYVDSTGSLHERVVLFTVETQRVPFVWGADRVFYRDLGHGFSQVIHRVGFMQSAKIEGALGAALGHKSAKDYHFFIGHETVQRKKEGSRLWYPSWVVYSIIKKTAGKMSDFFHLKYPKVFEVGLRVEI